MSTITISLPEQIAKKIDAEADREGFATRSEFIRSLLRRYFSKDYEFEVFKPQPIDQVKLELAKSGKYSQKFIESVTSGSTKEEKIDNKIFEPSEKIDNTLQTVDLHLKRPVWLGRWDDFRTNCNMESVQKNQLGFRN